MSALLATAIASESEFRTWCRAALVGDHFIYHIGDLAIDRLHAPRLNALADAIMLFAETGFVRTSQQRSKLAVGAVSAYIATRARQSAVPESVLDGTLTVAEYRALRAIADRAADTSTQRAVRQALTSSESAASQMIRHLEARHLILKRDNQRRPNGADTLTPEGREALHMTHIAPIAATHEAARAQERRRAAAQARAAR